MGKVVGSDLTFLFSKLTSLPFLVESDRDTSYVFLSFLSSTSFGLWCQFILTGWLLGKGIWKASCQEQSMLLMWYNKVHYNMLCLLKVLSMTKYNVAAQIRGLLVSSLCCLFVGLGIDVGPLPCKTSALLLSCIPDSVAFLIMLMNGDSKGEKQILKGFWMC